MNNRTPLPLGTQHALALGLGFALLASASGPVHAAWSPHQLNSGYDLGAYSSLDITADGDWTVGFTDAYAHRLQVAWYPHGNPGYFIEDAGPDGTGVSVRYSPSGSITASYVSGSKLYLTTQTSPKVWSAKAVDSSGVVSADTSLRYDSLGRPRITYFKSGRSGGLTTAVRNGSTWSSQRIDARGVRYQQMSMSPAGLPSVIYLADTDGNGTVDAVRIAELLGTSWVLTTLAGEGTYPTIGHHPATGDRAVAWVDTASGQLRYRQSTSSGWSAVEAVNTGGGAAVSACSLWWTGSSGEVSIAYSYGNSEIRVSRRDPATGVWTAEVVDVTSGGAERVSAAGRPGANLGAVAYRGGSFFAAPTTAQISIWVP